MSLLKILPGPLKRHHVAFGIGRVAYLKCLITSVFYLHRDHRTLQDRDHVSKGFIISRVYHSDLFLIDTQIFPLIMKKKSL